MIDINLSDKILYSIHDHENYLSNGRIRD